jgi:hypothetical protein
LMSSQAQVTHDLVGIRWGNGAAFARCEILSQHLILGITLT